MTNNGWRTVVAENGYHIFTRDGNLCLESGEDIKTIPIAQIDEFVCKNRDRDFDYLYKRELVALFCKTVIFRGVKTSLNNAIEQYSKEILDMLSEGSGKEECIGA